MFHMFIKSASFFNLRIFVMEYLAFLIIFRLLLQSQLYYYLPFIHPEQLEMMWLW